MHSALRNAWCIMENYSKLGCSDNILTGCKRKKSTCLTMYGKEANILCNTLLVPLKSFSKSRILPSGQKWPNCGKHLCIVTVSHRRPLFTAAFYVFSWYFLDRRAGQTRKQKAFLQRFLSRFNSIRTCTGSAMITCTVFPISNAS